MISFDEFKKLDIRVGEITNAEKIEGAEKLLRLEVDIGSDPSTSSSSLPQASSGREFRQIVAGIAQFYSVDSLIGKEITIIANLEPRVLKGVESQGMLLAASCDSEPVLLIPDKEVPPGSIVK